MMYPCQRVMISQVKQEDNTFTFNCKCVGIEMTVTTKEGQKFPVPARIKVITEACAKKCPAIKREAPQNAN